MTPRKMQTLLLALFWLVAVACGPRQNMSWLYTEGQVSLTVDVVREAVQSLAITTDAAPAAGQTSCTASAGIQGSATQGFRLDLFGDLDFNDDDSFVSLCGPVQWDLGDGPQDFTLQLEYWFAWGLTGTLVLDNGGGVMELWPERVIPAQDVRAQSGSLSIPIVVTGWGVGEQSPCPNGREQCTMRAQLDLAWDFSDAVIEQEAW